MSLSPNGSAPLLAVGERAPDFALPDESGAVVRLADLLAAGPVVVFFYPGAMTLGCTQEACHFRDAGADFAALGASRVGISADGRSVQSEFSRRNRLDFPLLTDLDGSVAKAYGARRTTASDSFKRATFAIGRDGTVLEVVSNRLRMREHAERSLDVLRAQAGASR